MLVVGGAEPLTASATSARRGDIQGLRAVAVLLVVVYHSGAGLPGGYIGVDVFFVISGYVITRILVAELAERGRLDLKRFYLRRIRRLLPALALMLSLVMLASVLLAPIGGQHVTARTGAAAALFNANTYLITWWRGYFDVSSDLNALLHTWSLSVEEQFYLVFPALLFGAWVLDRKRPGVGSATAATIALATIAVGSFVLSWIFTNGYTAVFRSDAVDDFAQKIAFYSPLTRAWQFSVGGLLALAASRLIGLRRAVTTTLAIGGAALVMFAAFAFDKQTPFPGTAALFPTIGTLLVLAAGENSNANAFSKALQIRPAQYLGDLSYSWYLWHWPFIVFAAALWPYTAHAGLYAGAASLLPAWLSYRFVEGPIRFAPRPKTTRTVALAAMCIATPLLSAVVLNVGHRAVTQSDTVVVFKEAFRLHADYVRGCDSPVPLGERSGSDCVWRVEEPIAKVVLVGDSFAGHFTEGFVEAANALNMDAVVATQSQCPFIDLVVVSKGERNEECRRFVTESVQFLIESQPRAVVISSIGTYIELEQIVLESPSDGERFVSASDKAAAWTDGLVRTIGELQSAGIDVFLGHTVPGVPGWDPLECAPARILLAQSSCGASRPLDEANLDRARVVAAVSAAAEVADALTFDVASELCPDGICSTYSDGTWIWRDGGHISVDASLLLTPIFVELLGSAR